MKVVIFGAGKFYLEKKDKIPPDVEIIAFLDNNLSLQGKKKDGHTIVSPEKINGLCYDKVILMSINGEAMKKQLLDLGVAEESVWYWEQFISEIYHGSFRFYCGNNSIKDYKRKILIISTDLYYNGGTIAAIYSAIALQDKGNLVVLAVPKGNRVLIKEVTESGIHIMLCPGLPYVHKEELFWIQQFDAVLVNVFQMVSCVCAISKIKPVVWWVHEFSEVYEKTIERFQKIIARDGFAKVNVYAVSHIAQRNFNLYFPNRISKTLFYGIPDKGKAKAIKEKNDNLTFAIIGALCPRKAQDIFVKAVELLDIDEKRGVQFWIIGFAGTDKFSTYVKELASQDSAIEIIGEVTRSKMHELYAHIDVVVCPSLEDPLPIVVTEGMMYGKTCIVSDAVGTANYINDGKDGFICNSGDMVDLCEKMRWIIRNKEKIHMIGCKARLIYKKYFDMDSFGKRLDKAIQSAIEDNLVRR